MRIRRFRTGVRLKYSEGSGPAEGSDTNGDREFGLLATHPVRIRQERIRDGQSSAKAGKLHSSTEPRTGRASVVEPLCGERETQKCMYHELGIEEL
ncbi:hypothetical protein N7535_002187 [Penicillium sp. DV-2018c]|nr:hypothetical protein N7461_004568 [Penicillium sp. DV-2018c]KAJ5583567.1 hypothetical protein N7535_002187 [Penicillium sp. DV-2018c]